MAKGHETIYPALFVLIDLIDSDTDISCTGGSAEDAERYENQRRPAYTDYPMHMRSEMKVRGSYRFQVCRYQESSPGVWRPVRDRTVHIHSGNHSTVSPL